MGRTCTICINPRRDEIDRLLLEGEPIEKIAADFDLSASSVRRHKAGHISAKLVRASDEREILAANHLLREMENLHRRTLDFLDAVEHGSDKRLFIAAIKEVRSNIELLIKLSVDLVERSGGGSFRDDPEWVKVRIALIEAVGENPTLQTRLIEALEDGNEP